MMASAVQRFEDGSGRWSVTRVGDEDRIVVTFRGRISEEDGRASARAFLAALGALGSVAITFDVRDVASYAGGARAAWQELLLPRRKQIHDMSVISRSRVTRMGAVVFAMVLGIPCHVSGDLPGDDD